MKNKKINGDYVIIPDIYWQLGLDIYQTNILARMMSWQRTGKVFFESYESLGCKFNMHKNTAKNKVESLEELGLIKRGHKVKRCWSWKVNETAVSEMIDYNMTCNNNERKEQEELQFVTPDVTYKNPKNINKNILREEEEPFVGSSPPTEKDVDEFIKQELDI